MTIEGDEILKDIPGEVPAETLVRFNNDELRARVFIDKYAIRDNDGTLLEKVPEEMWKRVAREISSVESEPLKAEWENKFYWLLENFRMIPGGRILFGAGQEKFKRRATLNNCYVIPIKDDSLESIFDWTKEAARTYSLGGGVGTDISVLRPRGAPVNNAALKSTGSVSFMNIMSETTGTIGQSGRRGALMITIRVDHPDIMDFIKVKRDLSHVRHANISVRITDEFMKKVEDDEDFTLRYESNKVKRIEKVVKARELWNELIESARNWAEPGLIFWDTMRKESTSEYNGMEILTTNPCSEIPLEAYGACNLGNINLALFVKNPFENAEVDWDDLEKAVRYTVRFLDDVVDYNMYKHPLKQQTDEAGKSRRIGVGFTGLGDMLIKLKIKYDTKESIDFVDSLFERMMKMIYDESTIIAAEKGTFPAFDLEKHLKSPFISRLGPELIEKIKKNGIRNVALITVPPVGSGSALAGTSSGIEPVFAFSYTRRSESLSKQTFKVYHPLVKEYMDLYGVKDEKDLPEYFMEAHKINPSIRIKLQATIQKYVDHSISSTVNLASTVTTEEVGKIYFEAWKEGCKGVTVYREGSREGILLTKEETKKKERKEFERSTVLTGRTIVFPLLETGKLYTTINFDENGSPVEIFVNVGKSGSEEKAYSEAIGRLLSLYLQQGGDISKVVRALTGIKGKTTTFVGGTKISSVPDGIAKAIDIAMKGEPPQSTLTGDFLVTAIKTDEKKEKTFATCPRCNNDTLAMENGCLTCKTCGYSKCE
ncbi:MAG: adenosylcobalamin-dependent ribonucleoside-diphosphate reductase [Thermoplasmatales archaeon]|jgi:ribonucleoside-diphosphate reductase alpha chain|nr:adenosylcobalamin-dependent ribonucleoside-diphosphate reductase [Candidatus Thermoplasmatota archaeon]MCL6002080.1 adenosylcobalamin-dependent ribonucleoside-diphosphate reductase [Candidatus Thermoplasmatota archaeon]MDA8055159.1 adenosylcobalamin-dependent ribonucleoside-diphosphate reductase [Thermoplasmatales archaeon]